MYPGFGQYSSGGAYVPYYGCDCCEGGGLNDPSVKESLDPADAYPFGAGYPSGYFDGVLGGGGGGIGGAETSSDSTTGVLTFSGNVSSKPPSEESFSPPPPPAPPPTPPPPPLPFGIFIKNRDLAFLGASGTYNLWPITHTFIFTTDQSGNIQNTYSWGNRANQHGWNFNQPEDLAAAQERV